MSETPGLRHLRQFADRHGFAIELLTGHDRYAIAHAGAAFSGHVDAIRVTEHGRFGNIFYQMLHAVLLARQIGATTVALFPFAGGPPIGRHVIDGLVIEVGMPPVTGMPALVGHFFNSYVFESALSGVPAEMMTGVVDRVLRPLLGHIAAAAAPGDPETVVVNLRGGDVFAGPEIPSWYVQPPASFHVRAALFAREAYGVSRAVLVSEDDRNPAIALTAAALEQAGLQVRRQSASFLEDAALMVNAAHLVSPFGTLCEALGMLSTRLRSYTAFRQFESHRHLHMRRPSVPLTVLRAHAVTAIRIVDRGMGYIPPLSWSGSDAQLDLLRRFPADRLHLDIPNDDADDACFAAFPPPGLPPTPRETFAMRQRMLIAEAAVIEARGAMEHSRRKAAESSLAADQAREAADEALGALDATTRQLRAAQAESGDVQAALRAARAEADALRLSTSWRVTAPLRRVTTMLRPGARHRR